MVGHFSSESMELFSLLASQTISEQFSEAATYDFTRCVRTDGSAYGASGQCRKGTEQEASSWNPKEIVY